MSAALVPVEVVTASRRPGNRAVTVAFLLACAAFLALLVVPWGAQATSDAGDGSTERVTLPESEGSGVVRTLVGPVLVTGIALAVAPLRRKVRSVVWFTTATALWLGVLGGMASIGVFFLPAAVAMSVASSRARPARLGRAA
jgi:hypothetical protein